MSEVFADKVPNLATGDKKPAPLTPHQVRLIVANAIDDAKDFYESEVKAGRILLDDYYQGKTRLAKTKGRSQIIVTKVRDAIKSVIPSIARIFMQTDEYAKFYSENEEDEEICSEITMYTNGVFNRYEGYTALIEGTIDALKAMVGVVKISLEKKTVVAHKVVPNDMADALEGKVTEKSDTESVVTMTSTRTGWSLKALPPEEFLIEANATSIETAGFCAHARRETVSDIVKMGFDYSELVKLPDDGDNVTEKDDRRNYSWDDTQSVSEKQDPSSRKLYFVESYIRMDADGDGIAELRRICTIGENYKVFSDEPVNCSPFAEGKAELQPHVFYTICLAEDMVQDQDAQTALLRSIIDNTALVNSPRTEVNESQVNIDDVKNGEIGAIVRVRQMGQIQDLVTPFVAGQTLPVLVALNEIAEQRSGITRLSQGQDADALQSTTPLAAAATVGGSDSRLEMMARNIGETLMKSILRCILRTAIYNLKEVQSIPIADGFKNVDPRKWHDNLGVKLAVGMGNGQIAEKKQALSGILPIQQQAIASYGLSNPLSGYLQARETVKDLLRLSGISDVNRYFPFIPQEQLQKMDQAAQEASKAKQDAQAAQQSAMVELVKVEAAKNAQRYQADMAKLQQQYATDMQKVRQEMSDMIADFQLRKSEILLTDDREREKNAQRFTVDSAKLGINVMDLNNQAEQIAKDDAAEKKMLQ